MILPEEDYKCSCGRDFVADTNAKQGMYICPAAKCQLRAIILPNGMGGCLRYDLPRVPTSFGTVAGGAPTLGKLAGVPASDPSGGPNERSVDAGLASALREMAGARVADVLMGRGVGALAKADAAAMAKRLIAEAEDKNAGEQ